MEISEEQLALNGIWQQHRYNLIALSESLAQFIERNQRFLIWDYVDHNELGVAFDHLLYVLFDEPSREIHLNPKQANEILILGQALKYPAESDIVYKSFLELYFPEELSQSNSKIK